MEYDDSGVEIKNQVNNQKLMMEERISDLILLKMLSFNENGSTENEFEIE